MTDLTSPRGDRGQTGYGLHKGLRLLAGTAGTALLAWLALQVIVNISPRQLDDANGIATTSGTSSAARVRHLEAQVMAAEGAVDWTRIRRSAQQILRSRPLESRALFLLGLAAEAEGREADAAALMGSAAGRSLRNRGAHFWLYSQRLGKGDVKGALYHADVILRVRPQLGATLLPALMSVASMPEGRTHLASIFTADHPWRSWFLREFSKESADPSDPSPLFAALQAGSSPPDSSELRPHLDRLISAGRLEQALVIWMTSLAPDERHDLEYLYNGDFERPISNTPFEWLIRQPRGAEIDVSESPLDAGKALRVQFARSRIAFQHVRKLIMLPPGSYRLSGKAKALDLRNERGLVWKLTCAEGSIDTLATTAPITGTMVAEIMQQFTVPQDCRAQWLQLELAARIPSEQDIGGGTVWYDSLRIQRIDDETPRGSLSEIRD